MTNIFDTVSIKPSPDTDTITCLLDEFKDQILLIKAESGNVYIDCGDYGAGYLIDGDWAQLMGITILPKHIIRRNGGDNLLLVGIFRRPNTEIEFVIQFADSEVESINVLHLHKWAMIHCPLYIPI